MRSHYGRNDYTTLAAAGTNQATAAALNSATVNVTGADGTKGVILPKPLAGEHAEFLVVINAEAAQNLKVYPHSGGKINAGSTDASITLSGGVTMTFNPASATEWFTNTESLASGQAAGAAGTVEASKAVVVDASKDIASFRNVTVQNLDAGAADGTEGTVDIFPTTASKGKIQIAATDNTADDTLTITNAAHGQATTLTIPDGGQAAASFVLTEGAQTLNGAKTIPALNTTNLDAGASGTAGSVDVFPTTAAKGKLALTVTDQVGNTTVGLVIGAMATARTITLADPLAAADILTGKMSSVARTATADGLTTGTIADAGMLQHVTVTAGGDADAIIVLPTPTPGRIVILSVGATGYELRTSDPANISINGGAGADFEMAAAANSIVIMVCSSATAWQGIHIAATTVTAPAAD